MRLPFPRGATIVKLTGAVFWRSRKAELCFLTVIVAVLPASCSDEFTFGSLVGRSVEGVF